MNQISRCAFDATVNSAFKDLIRFRHVLKFQHVADENVERRGSVFTGSEDETKLVSDSENRRWNGPFKFGLEVLPLNPANGWCLGSGKTRPGDCRYSTCPTYTRLEESSNCQKSRTFIFS